MMVGGRSGRTVVQGADYPAGTAGHSSLPNAGDGRPRVGSWVVAGLGDRFADQGWTAIDEAAVELHQSGPSLELGAGLTTVQHATGGDDRQFVLERPGQRRDDRGGSLEQRCAGES